MNLTQDQQYAMEECSKGSNIFITGHPGTGKSYLTQRIISSLLTKDILFAVTAPTGVAALNIKGTTINRFLGITLFHLVNLDTYLAKPTYATKAAMNNIRQIRILIIDEISMVHPDMFDFIDKVARSVRKNNRPFGGIQLIIIGDFAQIQPIEKDRTKKLPLLFETDLWEQCNFSNISLTTNMRQENTEFANLLSKIRIAELNDDVKQFIVDATKNTKIPDKHYVKLFTRNDYKDIENARKLAELTSPQKIYKSANTGDKNYLKDCIAPEILTLKKGAHVMLIKNLDIDAGLVNGTVGIVEGFSKEAGITLPCVKFNNGMTLELNHETWDIEIISNGKIKKMASRTQIPLIIAFGLTFHKCQGSTIEYLEVDLKDTFAYGMLYVALSRAKTKKGLIIKNFKEKFLICDDRVKEFYSALL